MRCLHLTEGSTASKELACGLCYNAASRRVEWKVRCSSTAIFSLRSSRLRVQQLIRMTVGSGEHRHGGPTTLR